MLRFLLKDTVRQRAKAAQAQLTELDRRTIVYCRQWTEAEEAIYRECVRDLWQTTYLVDPFGIGWRTHGRSISVDPLDGISPNRSSFQRRVRAAERLADALLMTGGSEIELLCAHDLLKAALIIGSEISGTALCRTKGFEAVLQVLRTCGDGAEAVDQLLLATDDRDVARQIRSLVRLVDGDPNEARVTLRHVETALIPVTGNGFLTRWVGDTEYRPVLRNLRSGFVMFALEPDCAIARAAFRRLLRAVTADDGHSDRVPLERDVSEVIG